MPFIKWLAGRSRSKRMYQMNQFPIWNKLHFRVTAKLLRCFFSVCVLSSASLKLKMITFLLLINNNETRLNRGNMIPSKEHHVTKYVTSCRIDFDLVILWKLRDYYYVIILNISFAVCSTLQLVNALSPLNDSTLNIETLHTNGRIFCISFKSLFKTSFHIHFSRTLKFQWQRRTWGIFLLFFFGFQKPNRKMVCYLFFFLFRVYTSRCGVNNSSQYSLFLFFFS